ncbi:hypothetical protein D3C85_1684420 [compost metagenome]
MKIYDVDTLEDLDNFDVWEAYAQDGYKFRVVCNETNSTYKPVFGKDEDFYPTYFEGWN